MISVITATYNRGYIIRDAYDSLSRQTSSDFEWIVIDDGSSDNTEDIINSFIANDNKFDILFYKQKNGGKHRAINRGVKYAKGEYCIILDSDDFLTDDAIEKIISWTKELQDPLIAGVAGLRVYRNGKCNNNVVMDGHQCDCDNLHRNKIGLENDCAEVYKREILLKYPFPEFENENFISEVASWNRIAKDGYKIRWHYSPIYVCEYLDDGLTKNIKSKLKENPKGTFYVARENSNNGDLIQRLKGIGFTANTMKSAGYRYSYIAKNLDSNTLLCFILSSVYGIKHRRDK